MPKPVEISRSQWEKLNEQLKKEYSISVILIRNKMKERLGFIPREYKDWDDSIGKYGGWRKNCIMLDFYSEKKRTWFMIKYSDYIQKEQINDNF
jgi:hypothetical protein